MKKRDALKLVEQKENLPVLPQLFYRIVRAASDPDTKVSELSNLILEDQVLTGRVLKMANSAYYAMPQKISTVTRAVMVLGFISLKNFITAVTVADTLNKDAFQGTMFEPFWIHALACGLSASFLAQNLKVDHPEEAMIGGLVHDCGKLFLDHHFPKAYKAVTQMVREGKDVLTAERKVFGLTHVDVGEEIARKWSLPTPLVAVIRDHHHLSGSSKDLPLSDIIYLANLLSSRVVPKEWGDRIQEMESGHRGAGEIEGICFNWGLSEDIVQSIIDRTTQNVQQIAEDLNLRFLNPSEPETADASPELFRLQRAMERKERQLSMVNEISAFVMENPRPEELIQVVIEAIHRGIGFNRTLLFIPNTAENTIVGRVGLGHDVPPFLRTIKVAMNSEGLIGRAIREKRTFNVVDAESQPCSDLPPLEVASLREIKTFAVAPFIAGTEVIGLVMVDNMVTGEPIRDQDVNLVRTFLAMAGVYLAGYTKKTS